VGRQRCPWATPEEKIILLERQTVCAGADKSEHCREFKEMNFHIAVRLMAMLVAETADLT
jgi:hypothetical protein